MLNTRERSTVNTDQRVSARNRKLWTVPAGMIMTAGPARAGRESSRVKVTGPAGPQTHLLSPGGRLVPRPPTEFRAPDCIAFLCAPPAFAPPRASAVHR